MGLSISSRYPTPYTADLERSGVCVPVVSLTADIWPSLATLQEQSAGNDWVSATLADTEEKATIFNDIRTTTFELARAGKLQINAFLNFSQLCAYMRAVQMAGELAASQCRLQECWVVDKRP